MGVGVGKGVALIMTVVVLARVLLLIRHLHYRFEVEPLSLVLNDFRWRADNADVSTASSDPPLGDGMTMSKGRSVMK